MLQLFFMDIDRYTSSFEVLQTTRVVEVQVSHDHSFDVLDIMASLFDLSCEFVLGRVIDTSENIVEWCTPDLFIAKISAVSINHNLRSIAYLWVIFPAAGFVEDEALSRMLNENADTDDLAARSRLIGS